MRRMRLSRLEQLDAHYLEVDEVAPAPALWAIRMNDARSRSTLVITQARTGSLPLGGMLDARYPPTPPHTAFCPCCGASGSETWGHHLAGECAASQDLWVDVGRRLRHHMSASYREWAVMWTEAATDKDQRAALLLAAADYEWMHGEDGAATPGATLLADWLQAIVDRHPLCQRRAQGEPVSDLQYCDRPYRATLWSSEEGFVEAWAEKVACQGTAVPTASEVARCLPQVFPGTVQTMVRARADSWSHQQVQETPGSGDDGLATGVLAPSSRPERSAVRQPRRLSAKRGPGPGAWAARKAARKARARQARSRGR